MKRPICLCILCFLALCINAQQTYKNIDLIIKGNLIPLADNSYEKEMNSASVTPYLRNYIPSIEIGLNNTYFFDFRYRVLLSEKQIETSLSGNPLSLNTKTTARHRCYSYSVAGGYNVLKNHPRHVAKIALVAGIVQNGTENCENNTASNSYFFQIGSEISYRYFPWKHFGFGASYEFSYANAYNKDPFISCFNLNINLRF